MREAHGKGLSMALSYFMDKDAVTYSSGRFRVNFEKIPDAVAGLTHDVLILQGAGNKAKAQTFADRWAKLGREAEEVLEKIKNAKIPVDVRAHYPIERELGFGDSHEE